MRRVAALLACGALAWALVEGIRAPVFEWPDVREPGEAVAFVGNLTLTPFAQGMDKPLAGVSPGDGSSRFFVVEQTGRIWEFADGVRMGEPYLDLRDRVATCHYEQGLLGIAFSPDFGRDGELYVAYTRLPCDGKNPGPEIKGDVVLSRFTTSADATTVDNGTEQELLRIVKPYRNHNGGHIEFGPDGMLYLGIGDGGNYGDPDSNGQDHSTLLGKILRLDVSGTNAAIPDDNPFVGTEGARGEIWLLGVRNPWGFTFDDATGDLWIADVGQDNIEEVNHLPLGTSRGANLGWSLFEGNVPYRPGTQPADLVFPVAQYRHTDGNLAIIGGPVLRGVWPDLEGAFLFGDFNSGWLWAVQPDGAGGYEMTTLMQTGLQITGFGQDGEGNVYLMHWDGSVHRLEFG